MTSGTASSGESALAPTIVIVVEDEALIQDLISSALEEAGFTVKAAADGVGAMRLLEAEDFIPRALVTDINIGGDLRGWDVAKRARELYPAIPVVYITGEHSDEWTSKGVPNSVIIEKPFAPAQVVTAVSHLLNAAAPSTDAP